MVPKEKINFDKLLERLHKDNPFLSYNGLIRQAEVLLAECPEELEQNLAEYIDEKPLSDIFIGKLSINKLMRTWNNSRSFTIAVTALYLYKETGCILEDDAIRFGAPLYDSRKTSI